MQTILDAGGQGRDGQDSGMDDPAVEGKPMFHPEITMEDLLADTSRTIR